MATRDWQLLRNKHKPLAEDRDFVFGGLEMHNVDRKWAFLVFSVSDQYKGPLWSAVLTVPLNCFILCVQLIIPTNLYKSVWMKVGLLFISSLYFSETNTSPKKFLCCKPFFQSFRVVLLCLPPTNPVTSVVMIVFCSNLSWWCHCAISKHFSQNFVYFSSICDFERT